MHDQSRWRTRQLSSYSSFSHSKSIIGKYGEAIASECLSSMGYAILVRNWRFRRYGEIDLIIERDSVVAAVEVKTRKSTSCGSPLEAITDEKLKRLRWLFSQWLWLSCSTYQNHEVRIDGFGILLRPGGESVLDYRPGLT